MSKEIFKDIPGYEGHYQVSNLGRVKSLKRSSCIRNKILKPGAAPQGALAVGLSKNSVSKTICISVLMAMAFLEYKPDGRKIVVDHINNINTDNRLENLQIITQRETCNKDKKPGSSKYTGVCWCKRDRKWISRIIIDRKKIYLGNFKNEIDAHNAYQRELKKLN